MHKKLFFSFFAAVLIAVPPVAFGQENDGTQNGQDAVLIADVNIYDAQIVSQDSSKFVVSFEIANGEMVQSAIRYGIELVQDLGGSRVSIVDRYVYDETISLSENDSMKKTVTYEAPAMLSGTYRLMVVSMNQSSLSLGLSTAGEVTLTRSMEGVMIDKKECYLTISGEPDTRYTVSQGVSIRPSESLTLHCVAENTSQEKVDATPFFETTFRTGFGNVADKNMWDTLTLSSGKNNVDITLPSATVPQSYDIAVVFKDKSEKTVSPTIVVHYVLAGASATIQNVRFDRDYYRAGETAQLSFFWSGSADSFSGSRVEKTALDTLDLSVAISGAGKPLCANPIAKKISDVEEEYIVTIPVSMTKDCMDPTATASIRDKNGKVLAEATFGVVTKDKPVAQQEKRDAALQTMTRTPLLLIGIVPIAIVILFVIWRSFRRRSHGTLLFILGIVSAGVAFLGTSPSASATTYYNGGAYTVNYNSSSYRAGIDTVRFDATVHDIYCVNGNDSADFALQSKPGSSSSSGSQYVGCPRGSGGWINYVCDYDNAKKGDEVFYPNDSWTAPSTAGTYYTRFAGVINDKYQSECGKYGTDTCYTETNKSYAVTPLPTLSASLSANPASGNVPLASILTATRTGGTATGTITYHFRCKSTDAFSAWQNTNTYSCNYPIAGTYTAGAEVRQQSIIATKTTPVTVNACAPNNGTACTSGSNSCGMTSTGTINCAGTCSGTIPEESLCDVCYPDCSQSDQVCAGEPFTDANNCATNNCTGTRSCDYNWKEVAP